MAISEASKYKLVRRDGIFAIIIHDKKILLLKRRSLPIIINPGIWSFLSGGRDGKEQYIETACREINEEVGLKAPQLKLLAKTKVLLKAEKTKRAWPNHLFIFRSSTDRIKLDLENSAYRWAPFSDISNENNYTNVFINEEPILNKIKGFVDEPKGPKGKGK